MIYYSVSRSLLNDLKINAYYSCQIKLFLPDRKMSSWSWKKWHYANAFWIFFVKWQSKISRCFPAGELKYSGPFSSGFPKRLTPRKRLFPIDNITAGKHIC